MADRNIVADRWEEVASALATAVVTVTTIVQANPELVMLQQAPKVIASPPGWVRAVIAVPIPLWLVLTAALAAALYWLGLRLARKFGPLALFMAPAVMLALQYLIPLILLSPMKTGAGALPS